MRNVSNYFLTFFIIIFAVCLIFFSSTNIVAVQTALDLFLNAIFPSLFPFLIVCELLTYTQVIPFLSAKFERIMKPLFKVSGIGAYPLVMGLLSGYPVGARIVADLRNKNLISKNEGERLLVFTNNAGPLFIIGSIGCSIYLNRSIGFLLLAVHIISSIFTGFVFGRIYGGDFRSSVSSELSFSTFGEVVSKSIKKAFYTLSNVCGFVILFSLIISMIQSSGILSCINNVWVESTVLGLFEITHGIKLISSISGASLLWNLVITAFLLGTGGLCVLLQVWSTISNTDLSIIPYVFGKVFNGVFSAVLMFVVLNLFPVLQFAI